MNRLAMSLFLSWAVATALLVGLPGAKAQSSGQGKFQREFLKSYDSAGKYLPNFSGPVPEEVRAGCFGSGGMPDDVGHAISLCNEYSQYLQDDGPCRKFMNIPMCEGAEAIERDIELIATHLRLGNLMREPGPEQDLSAAIENYSHAIDIDNSTILQYQQDHGLKYLGLEALLQRARTYGAMHELDRAAADIDLLLNIWPQHSLPWFEKARIEIARGGFSEAVRLLDKAIERQPDFAQAYYHRAYAHQKLGDNAQAARDCRAAQTFDASIKCN